MSYNIPLPPGIPLPEKNFIEPCPPKFQEVLDNLNAYSFQQLLDILDAWHVKDAQGNSKLISNYWLEKVRKRVQFLKLSKKTVEVKDAEPIKQSNRTKRKNSRKTNAPSESSDVNLLDGSGQGMPNVDE